ncbi:hypothetical protein [Methylobacterium komagatae]|uniref:hypothetical protein n=1 Tax=Methylobacterium komagatae TaxID=374425 RepID=UPI00366DBF4B
MRKRQRDHEMAPVDARGVEGVRERLDDPAAAGHEARRGVIVGGAAVEGAAREQRRLVGRHVFGKESCDHGNSP